LGGVTVGLLPLVVPERVPRRLLAARPTITVSTILDAPDRLLRCRGCRRRVRRAALVAGYGPKCARARGLTGRPSMRPPRAAAVPARRWPGWVGPDLLDLLAAADINPDAAAA
jgi:hypothetical protein